MAIYTAFCLPDVVPKYFKHKMYLGKIGVPTLSSTFETEYSQVSDNVLHRILMIVNWPLSVVIGRFRVL